MLEESGIKTLGHKEHWRTTTVTSILKNENIKVIAKCRRHMLKTS